MIDSLPGTVKRQCILGTVPRMSSLIDGDASGTTRTKSRKSEGIAKVNIQEYRTHFFAAGGIKSLNFSRIPISWNFDYENFLAVIFRLKLTVGNYTVN